MNPDSNKSDLEKIRNQLEGVHGTSSEWTQDAKSTDKEESVERGDVACNELKEWLQQSSENKELFDQVREFDSALLAAMKEVPGYEPGFEERLKVLVQSSDADSVDAQDLVYEDLFESAPAVSGISECEQAVVETNSQQIEKNPSHRKWWMAMAGSLVTTAAVVMVMFLFKADPPAPEVQYTAEVLCDDSLLWNPNKGNEQPWSSDLSKAPSTRHFPGHLIRLKAQSWKTIAVADDQQAVVYNLIPEGNLAELKAYVYVFKTDRDYQLPADFDSHPTSNRKYRFWSVACQQDLVFVLVFEGDEKRLQDLIKIQQVG